MKFILGLIAGVVVMLIAAAVAVKCATDLTCISDPCRAARAADAKSSWDKLVEALREALGQRDEALAALEAISCECDEDTPFEIFRLARKALQKS